MPRTPDNTEFEEELAHYERDEDYNRFIGRLNVQMNRFLNAIPNEQMLDEKELTLEEKDLAPEAEETQID